jgi:hypothetical protein
MYEAVFHTNGHVNRQNCRIWRHERMHEIDEHVRDSLEVDVWCSAVYGAENTVTVNFNVDIV